MLRKYYFVVRITKFTTNPSDYIMYLRLEKRLIKDNLLEGEK
jgi:hypothetical protein